VRGLQGCTDDGSRKDCPARQGVLSPASVRLMTTNQIGGLRNWQLTQNKWGYLVDIHEGENAPSGSLHYLGGPGA
jgi:hypothetical protein